MTWTDFKLKAPTEADAMNAAIDALAYDLNLVAQDEQGDYQWVKASHNHAFDPIGPRVVTPGTYDENGDELTAPVMDTDFHANLRVKSSMAADVETVLNAVGPSHGVTVTSETGRVWA